MSQEIASSFVLNLHINAQAPQIYSALISADGMRGWWTSDCEVHYPVGQCSTFRFGNTYSVLQKIRQTADREVAWRCIRHHLDGGVPPNEWVGTTLCFRLSRYDRGGTDLTFEHLGLTPALKCYSTSSEGWDRYLRQSLKSYVETGEGRPCRGAADGIKYFAAAHPIPQSSLPSPLN